MFQLSLRTLTYDGTNFFTFIDTQSAAALPQGPELAAVEAEERQKALGKLKIFLGYAAGVGKTYAMLEAAHQRKEQGCGGAH